MARLAAKQRGDSDRRARPQVGRHGSAKARAKRAGTRSNPREGSTLDSFLREEGHYETATATAVKETIAWQIANLMTRRGVSKTDMASRMGTSRAALDRLLDPENDSVTLATLLRAAEALGVGLTVRLKRRE